MTKSTANIEQFEMEKKDLKRRYAKIYKEKLKKMRKKLTSGACDTLDMQSGSDQENMSQNSKRHGSLKVTKQKS